MEQEEWKKLNELLKELNNNMMAYDVEVHEKFTELLVKSLEGKGNGPVRGTVSPTL